MIPTWVAVVTGISLAILALAAIVIAAASVVAALGVRGFLRMLHELAGPAVGDVRALVAKIGRAHVWTPVTSRSRLTSSALKKKRKRSVLQTASVQRS